MLFSRLGLGTDTGDLFRSAGQRSAGHLAVLLSRLSVRRPTAPVGILIYHRVSPIVPAFPQPTMNVTPSHFRAQLTGLVSRGFHIWPLSRLLACHRMSTPVPPRTVVITFDDGFECIYRHAWPILRELALPSTVFLATAFLDSDSPFPFDHWGMMYASEATAGASRPLRTNQVLEMKSSGLVEFGAHTHSHQDFRGRYDAFRLDLEKCVDVLLRRFDEAHPTFAFPFGRRHSGHVDDRLLDCARSAGVTCALTTEAQPVHPESDPFGWGRFNVYEWDTPATLQAKLEGHYGWAPRLQERFARERALYDR